MWFGLCPLKAFCLCPVVFLKLPAQVFQEMPAIHEWGLKTGFLIALLTADGWFFYYQMFKNQKDIAAGVGQNKRKLKKAGIKSMCCISGWSFCFNPSEWKWLLSLKHSVLSFSGIFVFCFLCFMEKKSQYIHYSVYCWTLVTLSNSEVPCVKSSVLIRGHIVKCAGFLADNGEKWPQFGVILF